MKSATAIKPQGIIIAKPAAFYGFLMTFLRPLIAVKEFDLSS
jgi:hypothetical protein